MQNRKSSLYLAVVASVGLLMATPAMAQDPNPLQFTTCSVAGYTIVATAPEYVECGTLIAPSTCTEIKYTVGGGQSTPDHVGTFVRSEVPGLAFFTEKPSGRESVSVVPTSCTTGDSVLGLGSNLLCHDRLFRFNSNQLKFGNFIVSGNGRRKPLLTTVIARKGSTQQACQIVGLGLEDVTGGDACVTNCGNFNASQSVRKVETFKFKDCEVTFEFDPTTGQVIGFDAQPVVSGVSCNKLDGPVSALLVNGGIISGTNDEVTFGDGWINSGLESCTTRLVGGRYYSVCQ